MRYKYFLVIITVFGIIFFYLKRQIEIVKLQYKIKELYDSITVIEAENKILSAEIESLKSYSRLESYAVKFGFIKPKSEDIEIVYYE